MRSTIVKSKCQNQVRKDVASKRAPLWSESGQSLLEFALLLPILLLLGLGTIEMGRFAYIGILVGNAARAGASWGAQSHTTAADTNGGIETAADNDFQNNGPALGSLNVTHTVVCGCDNGGTITGATCSVVCPAGAHLVDSLSVTTSGTFSAIFNYPGIPTSIAISRTATQRIGF
jgi:Flp pilus assembly protein TadG